MARATTFFLLAIIALLVCVEILQFVDLEEYTSLSNATAPLRGIFSSETVDLDVSIKKINYTKEDAELQEFLKEVTPTLSSSPTRQLCHGSLLLPPNPRTLVEQCAGLSPSDPNFHLLVPLTHMNVMGCRTLKTALLQGYHPILINYGAKMTEWEAHIKKIQGVQAFLRADRIGDMRIHPADIVTMIDGYDVWAQADQQSLLRHFKSLGGGIDGTIILGADKRCSPNPINSSSCVNVPPSRAPSDMYGTLTDKLEPWQNNAAFNTRPRWANSGLVMGRIVNMRSLYDELARRSKLHDDKSRSFSDQFYFNEIFSDVSNHHNKYAFKIKLDYSSNLIQQMGYSIYEVAPREHPLHDNCTALTNTILNHQPVFAHTNGVRGLYEMWHYWESMWWGNCTETSVAVRLFIDSKVIRLANSDTTYTYGELCDDFDDILL